jgi:hypothetical protein
MDPKKIYICTEVENTPLMWLLVNPSKTDIRESIKALGSLIKNNPETVRRLNPKTEVVNTTILEVETKVLVDK